MSTSYGPPVQGSAEPPPPPQPPVPWQPRGGLVRRPHRRHAVAVTACAVLALAAALGTALALRMPPRASSKYLPM